MSKLAFWKKADKESSTGEVERANQVDDTNSSSTEDSRLALLAQFGINPYTSVPKEVLTPESARRIVFDREIGGGYDTLQVDSFVRNILVDSLNYYWKLNESRNKEILQLASEIEILSNKVRVDVNNHQAQLEHIAMIERNNDEYKEIVAGLQMFIQKLYQLLEGSGYQLPTPPYRMQVAYSDLGGSVDEIAQTGGLRHRVQPQVVEEVVEKPSDEKETRFDETFFSSFEDDDDGF